MTRPTAPCLHCNGTGDPQSWAESVWLGECAYCSGSGRATLSPVSPAPVSTRAADEHDDRPGAHEPGRSASTT